MTEYSIPFFVLVNTYDDNYGHLWDPKSKQNKDILNNIWYDLLVRRIEPLKFGKRDCILAVNLIWYWLSIFSTSDSESIQLSQENSVNYWERYYKKEISSRSLALKSNFTALFSKITSDEFLRCALISKAKREQIKELHKLADRFITSWERRLNALRQQ